MGILEVTLQLRRLTLRHAMYVAVIDHGCLLGMDFLQKNNCRIDFAQGLLQVGSTEVHFENTPTQDYERLAIRHASKKSRYDKSAPVPLQGDLELELSQACASKLPEVLPAQPCGVTRPTSRPSEKLYNNDVRDLLQRSASNLSEEQHQRLLSVLVTNEGVFSSSPTDLGRTSLHQHRIETGEASPIKLPPRRIPYARREEAENLVREMLEQGIIKPSESPWCSPVVLVRKKTGKLRFCVDYRRLNEVTKKDSYPLPRMDLILEALAGSGWFATLDLQSGYWQVELEETAREKTAFSFGRGLYEFSVMPFGLCNAPATFQRLMERVLHDVPFETCLVYLDDVLVHAKTFDELLDKLELVFRRLRAAGLKLSPTKCELCQKSVTYLGHVISPTGIGPDPEKVAAVRDWPTPRNQRDVRSFIGLCGYYRRFISDFSGIARPLHQLTEKGRKFLWSEACEDAFQQLKSRLIVAPILCQPRFELPFCLDTDASQHAMGAVLSQNIDDGERVIEYYSKTFNKAEQNYCVTRRELLAVVKAVKHFQPYLLGRRFTLRTDHASLKWLMNFREPEGQVARWIQRLQEYDFEIIHRPGTRHVNADALSRRPCTTSNCRYCSRLEEQNTLRVRLVGIIDNFSEAQRSDPVLGVIYEWLARKERPKRDDISGMAPALKAYWNMWSTLFLCSGKLCRHVSQNVDDRHQLLVPQGHINDVITSAHNGPTGGHFGIQKTLQKVKQQFYWIDCSRDVENFCQCCTICQARNGPRRKQRSRLQPYDVGAPFERVAIDLLGPLPTTERGNRYILVLMDYFTKWPEAAAIPNQTAETVAEALVEHVFTRFGAPLQLHSDQGRNFESNVFREVMRLFAIDKTRTTPLHPQSDGMVERFNRTILNYLAKFVDDNQKNWDLCLPLLLMSYRTAVHESTKQTPAMLLFGRELRMPTGLSFGYPPGTQTTTSVYARELIDRLRGIHDHNRHALQQTSRRMKDRYDLKANTSNLMVGSWVWLYSPKKSVGRCPKLQCDWEGPYEILEALNDVLYRIRRKGKLKTVTVHRDRMMPYVSSRESDEADL